MEWKDEYRKYLLWEKRNDVDVDLDAKNDVDVDNYVQYIYNTIFI